SWEKARVRGLLRKLALRVSERAPGDGENEEERPYEARWYEDRVTRRRTPEEVAPVNARLRQRLADGRARLTTSATPAEAQPEMKRAAVRADDPESPETLAAIMTQAAQLGAPLLLRTQQSQRIVHIERLRKRGRTVYVEGITLDGNEGFALPLHEIVGVNPVEVVEP